MARDPYDDLAPYYDEMGKDPAIETFYGEWRRSLVAAMAQYRVRPRVLVDLACGTGNSTVPWTGRHGLSVVGVDRSEAMLRVQFDLNTRHMLRWLGGREKLLRAGRHWYMAQNAFDASTGVATFRQFWFVAHGPLYRRLDVTVQERAYGDRELRRMLRRAGMRLVDVRVQRTVAGRPGRKVYLARKPSG